MRWVFYSLIILNLLYLGWHMTARLVPADTSISVSAGSAPDRLRLLSEAPVDELAGAADAPETEVRAPAPLCTVVGPWSVAADARRAAASLASYQAEAREFRVQRDRLNWVYLPAAENREEALRALGELQSQGVDSFVVSEGEDANAISLGYFSSPDSARGLQVRMQNAGYPAEVRETAREVSEYWLEITPAQLEDDARLRAFLSDNPDLERERAACGGGRPLS